MTSRHHGRSRSPSPGRNLSGRKESSTLELVRIGVRRFILNDASIGDFHRTLRSAAKRGTLSPHPLTGAVFRNIVREAIDKRKRTVKKRRQR